MEFKPYNTHEVVKALENISFEKATSWDYIPGLAYKKIYEIRKSNLEVFEDICKNLADLLTN